MPLWPRNLIIFPFFSVGARFFVGHLICQRLKPMLDRVRYTCTENTTISACHVDDS